MSLSESEALLYQKEGSLRQHLRLPLYLDVQPSQTICNGNWV